MNIDEMLQLASECCRLGNLNYAGQLLEQVINTQPDNMEALCFMAEISYRMKSYDVSIELLKRLMSLSADTAEIYNNIALVQSEKGALDDAIESYKNAILLNPDLADIHYNLGNILRERNQSSEAMRCYRKAVQLNSNSVDSLINLGNVLQELKNYDEAAECYEKALRLSPENSDLHNNLGLVFQEKLMFKEAVLNYEKAVELNPNKADVHNNLGFAFQLMGKLGEAIDSYREALELDPNYANAHWNLARALLLTGNMEEGWREYEWRWKADTLIVASQKCSQSLFTLDDISGRTILLHAEQGFGDNIQFIRYAPLIAQCGAKVIVECHEELSSLFRNIGGIVQVIGFNEQPPKYDVNCPLLSLPLIFGTTLETIPANVPYLAVSSSQTQRWKERMAGDSSELKVGLVWHGNPKIPRKHMSLNHFSGFSEVKNVSFYSLQKGEAAEQAKHPPGGMRLFNYTEEIKDFSDTAAIIENLDLIITIDTAVAHLAGALGRPVWTLIPFAPDWRWLLDREDNPWYPTMRLFRQRSNDDWNSAIEQIAVELRGKIA
jgi:tetratricopeptide (TPR) repeat protein